jgi:four helix bundle protein
MGWQPRSQVADTVGVLSFQKLDVYRCSIEFLALSVELPANLPRGHAALAEQLRRAALSIPLNIAEAAGRTGEADAARHYGIARGSTMECAAIVDALGIVAAIPADQHAAAARLLERLVAMLTKLCSRSL